MWKYNENWEDLNLIQNNTVQISHMRQVIIIMELFGIIPIGIHFKQLHNTCVFIIDVSEALNTNLSHLKQISLLTRTYKIQIYVCLI